jgi:hypothetical protein
MNLVRRQFYDARTRLVPLQPSGVGGAKELVLDEIEIVEESFKQTCVTAEAALSTLHSTVALAHCGSDSSTVTSFIQCMSELAALRQQLVGVERDLARGKEDAMVKIRALLKKTGYSNIHKVSLHFLTLVSNIYVTPLQI